ncbi:hypothetical protein Goshw_029931, partial [Gossypium schwendimanii]|nr:hypothetical protein [Gossypium schwendimanii]
MDLYSPGPFNLLIRESYATIFWVRFQILFTETYIIEMIGGYLMSDLSQNLVHLRWLLKLVDFRAAGEFSWESTVLATLYREMLWATLPNKAKIGGCLSLLQS